jgi:gluconate 5-dehydrogenase
MKINELFDIAGHVAFVTGAADGLGRAFAEVMADNGAHVVLTDCDAAKLATTTETLAARGCSVESMVVDIGDTETLRAAIDATAKTHGRLDTVFANAGISAGPGFHVSPAGQLENLDLASFKHVLDLNLTATTLTMQFAARHMKPAKRGSIVVNTSIGGIKAEPMVGYAYAGTKSAMNNIVRLAAVELAPFNIRVNAIAPGPFLTNIGNGRLHTDPTVAAKFTAMIPLGRLGQPWEIQGLALLLASPGGAFLTGTVIPIDGGATAG